MTEHGTLVEALCEGRDEAVLAQADPDVRVFAPVGGVASPGSVDGRGAAALRAGLGALRVYGPGGLEVLAAAHDGAVSLLELATRDPDRRPVTVVVCWDAADAGPRHIDELRLYFDPFEAEEMG